LLRRLAMGEAITSPHRRHYYQQALDGGLSVYQIVARVFVQNIALVALALATIVDPSTVTQAVALVVGCGMVTALLVNFSRQASASSSAGLR
jgi:hypothetical protein